MKCEGELINMTRAWDKEKQKNSEFPTGIEMRNFRAPDKSGTKDKTRHSL